MDSLRSMSVCPLRDQFNLHITAIRFWFCNWVVMWIHVLFPWHISRMPSLLLKLLVVTWHSISLFLVSVINKVSDIDISCCHKLLLTQPACFTVACASFIRTSAENYSGKWGGPCSVCSSNWKPFSNDWWDSKFKQLFAHCWWRNSGCWEPGNL